MIYENNQQLNELLRRRIIMYSKRSLLLDVFFMSFFAICSLYCAAILVPGVFKFNRTAALYSILIIILTVVCGFCVSFAIKCFKKAFGSFPAMIVDPDGISINPGYPGAYEIKWRDIKKIEFKIVYFGYSLKGGVKRIIIELKNYQHYREKYPKRFSAYPKFRNSLILNPDSMEGCPIDICLYLDTRFKEYLSAAAR